MANQFYGQFEYQLDKYLYDNFFNNKKNGISIEAGASNGILENNTFFFEKELNWKTINVEPLPEWYSELIINRPNSVNLNYCLHPYENNTIAKFFIPNISVHNFVNHLGSLNKDNLTKYNTDLKEIETKTITFNEIINKNNLTEIDLFILDIEGFELEFLKSFDEWKIYPKVFVIEIGHIGEIEINNIILKKYNFYSNQYVNNIYTLKNNI